MNYYVVLALGFLILAPAFISLYRYKTISRKYYPLMYIIWIGSINEIINFLLPLTGISNYVTINVYFLIESVLLLYFFKRIEVLNSRVTFNFLLAFIVLSWLVESFLFEGMQQLNSYFLICYSVLVLLLTFVLLNEYFLHGQAREKKSVFLISAAFLLYYLMLGLNHAFWKFGLNAEGSFLLNLHMLLVIANAIANILYAIAILWAPRKLGYSLAL